VSFTRPLPLKGRVLGGGNEPLVCTPVVGRDEDALRREVATVAARRPDLIEWRVDFFGALGDTARVVRLAQELRALAGDIPILFTRRSIREGGTPIDVGEDQVFALYEAVCRAGSVDQIDWELSSEPRWWTQAVELSRATGVPLVASFHDFQRTPSKADLVAKFAAMQDAGADVAKIAVMPRHLRDVLTLLDATLEARETLRVPLISMSMGAYGSLSRLFGWMYGSSVTFAVGDQASAPGQVPMEDLAAVFEVLQRALKGAG